MTQPFFFHGRQRDFNTNIGTKARIDFLGNIYISDILNNPEVKYQIFWQAILLKENKRHKKELSLWVEQVRDEIDQELKARFKYK